MDTLTPYTLTFPHPTYLRHLACRQLHGQRRRRREDSKCVRVCVCVFSRPHCLIRIHTHTHTHTHTRTRTHTHMFHKRQERENFSKVSPMLLFYSTFSDKLTSENFFLHSTTQSTVYVCVCVYMCVCVTPSRKLLKGQPYSPLSTLHLVTTRLSNYPTFLSSNESTLAHVHELKKTLKFSDFPSLSATKCSLRERWGTGVETHFQEI